MISSSRPPRIKVRNLQRKIPVDVVALQQVAAKGVRCCLRLKQRERTKLRRLHEIFVWLISDYRMSRLHHQFLGQEGATDVLTFQHGEIFISVGTAKRNARTFATSLVHELELYIVHGLLHLNGFDDRTSADARTMKEVQEKILGECTGAG